MTKKFIEIIKGKENLLVRIRDEETGPVIAEKTFANEKELSRYLQETDEPGDLYHFKFSAALSVEFKGKPGNEELEKWADKVRDGFKEFLPETASCSLLFHEQAWKKAYKF